MSTDYDDGSASSLSKISRNISPIKQIRHAELQPTGFRHFNFATDECKLPFQLRLLKEMLKVTWSGFGVVPLSLHNDLAGLNLPDFFFTSSWNDYHFPDRHFIRDILLRATKCELEGQGESSWNEVHTQILTWLTKDGHDSEDCLSYEFCPNATLLREFKPHDVPSKMVDYCLTVRPTRPEQNAIDQLRSQRPGNSINQTDCGTLRKHPIAASIEVKRPGEDYTEAVLQIGTWHSAQWRSLRWGTAHTGCMPKIQFLTGIIISGHDWQFIPSVVDEDNICRLVRPALQMGDTRTAEGIIKLLASLQTLKADSKRRFWSEFKEDVLGIPRY